MKRSSWIIKLAAVGFFFCLLLVGLFFRGEDRELVIERNKPGEGSREVTIYADGEPVTFIVGEEEYLDSELDQIFEEGFLKARKEVLGENPSADQVRTDLNFSVELPAGIQAEWISSDLDIILSDGKVMNEEWEDGKNSLVTVTLTLSYGERMEQEKFYFRVLSPVRNQKDTLLRRIKNQMKLLEGQTRDQSNISLPKKIGDATISLQVKRGPWTLLFLVFACCSAVWILRQNRKEEIERIRRDAWKEDYPVFVNQIILYLGAGMSLRAVFERILSEESEKAERENREERPLLTALRLMHNEMSAGVAERQAYENFGRRSEDQTYMVLMSLLLQNLQKGNEGLLDALRMEEEAAFHKNLDRARVKGEQAGTKLLFPMLILLVVVMVIVMAPALLQFGTY